MAVTGFIPNKYTRIGTDRIEPPLPINPKMRPTINAPKNPINSKVSKKISCFIQIDICQDKFNILKTDNHFKYLCDRLFLNNEH